MRCVIVEAETREDVMKEMEERMREIEKTYSQRLMSEVKSGPRGRHINLQRLSGGEKRAENGCQDRHAASSWTNWLPSKASRDSGGRGVRSD